jgi:endonuclease YncB( thermonuclease family)
MRLVTGKDVRCSSMGADQHGRTLGRCMVGTTDINRTMVATGYAVAYRHSRQDPRSRFGTASQEILRLD